MILILTCSAWDTQILAFWAKQITRSLILFYYQEQINFLECTDLSSNHTPVINNFSYKALLTEYLQRIYSQRTDWNNYRAKIINSINQSLPLRSVENFEMAVESLNKFIHQMVKVFIPAQQWIVHNNNTSYYSKLIKEKVNERRYFWKKWHTYMAYKISLR